MRRATILLLTIALCVGSTAQDSTPKLVTTSVGGVITVATTAASAAGPWWSALFGLVGQFLTAFTGGGKVDTKTAQKAVSSNADGLGTGLTSLKAWPDLLDSSQQFREDAIQLGQMVSQLSTSPDDITDNQWSDFTIQVSSVQGEFKKVYETQTNITILQNAPEYQLITHNANDAWNNVTKQLKHTNKTSADRKSTLQSVNGSTQAITEAAMLPEWLVIEEARALVAQYQSVTTQAKSVQAGKSGSQPSGTPQPGASTVHYPLGGPTRPRLLSISFPSPNSRIAPVSVDSSAAERVASKDQKSLSEKAADSNRVPLWMTNSLNVTRSEYRTNWRQTLIAGLVGASVGFICMLFLPAFAKSRLAPHHAPELDILQRSLAFRSDERSDLEQQLGALHLDMLNYVWTGDAASRKLDRSTSEASSGSTDRVQRLERIAKLRTLLKS